jgi:Big-like domain-containing protein
MADMSGSIRRLSLGLTMSLVAVAVASGVVLPQPALAAPGPAPTFTAVTAVSGSATVTAGFSLPLKCSSVAPKDFRAAVNGVARTVTKASCTGTSDATVGLLLASPFLPGDIVAATLVARVVDRAGHPAPTPVTLEVTVTADTDAPALAVTSGPADGSVSSKPQPVYHGTATDPGGALSRVEASVDGIAFDTGGVSCGRCATASATWSFTPTVLADGFHTLAWRSVDQTGNVSTVTTFTVTVDTTVPALVSLESAGADAATAVFSKPIKCLGTAATDFSATVNDVPRSVTAASCTGTTDDTIDLALGTLQAGDLISVTLVGIVRDSNHQQAVYPTTCTTVV